MAQREFVKTGVSGLDEILSPGIPRGNVILLEGAIGTGKTTLGVEFVYRGAIQFDEPGIIVLFEVSPDRLARDAANFGWDLPALEAQGKLKIIFTTREVFRQELPQTDSMLLEVAAEIGARRMYVDGMVRSGDNRDAFHVLVDGLQRKNLTAAFSIEGSAIEGERRQALHEESIADTVIRLRIEDKYRAAVRSIEVVKSRGHHFQMGRHSLRILDGHGVKVYRRVQAPRMPSRDHAAAFDTSTRVSTGTPGLDAVVNGGYFIGSTTVVSGISGVGKSVMGLQYIAEGARLGERSLMLTLDEQVPQILRNAKTIGIDLQPHIDSGLVRLQYDAPQEMEIDVHFHDVEQIVETFKPKRVLIDSLSTYGANMGTGGRVFRDFFHALVALMKEHQTAAVYNHENPEMLGMSSMMGDFAMSSLVDNILLMNWIEMGDVFRLGLTVAKMRANPNIRSTHECEILDGVGLRVLPQQIPAPRVYPFASYQGLISRAPVRVVDRPAT